MWSVVSYARTTSHIKVWDVVHDAFIQVNNKQQFPCPTILLPSSTSALSTTTNSTSYSHSPLPQISPRFMCSKTMFGSCRFSWMYSTTRRIQVSVHLLPERCGWYHLFIYVINIHIFGNHENLFMSKTHNLGIMKICPCQWLTIWEGGRGPKWWFPNKPFPKSGRASISLKHRQYPVPLALIVCSFEMFLSPY